MTLLIPYSLSKDASIKWVGIVSNTPAICHSTWWFSGADHTLNPRWFAHCSPPQIYFSTLSKGSGCEQVNRTCSTSYRIELRGHLTAGQQSSFYLSRAHGLVTWSIIMSTHRVPDYSNLDRELSLQGNWAICNFRPLIIMHTLYLRHIK